MDVPNQMGENVDPADPRFMYLRDAVMLSSDPKPGYHIEGIFVMSIWHNPEDDEKPEIADFVCSPPQNMRALLASVVAFAKEIGVE